MEVKYIEYRVPAPEPILDMAQHEQEHADALRQVFGLPTKDPELCEEDTEEVDILDPAISVTKVADKSAVYSGE